MTDEKVQAMPMQQKAEPKAIESKSTHNFISRFFIRKFTRSKLKHLEGKKEYLWDKKFDVKFGSKKWTRIRDKIKEIEEKEEKLKRKLELL